MSYVSYVLMSKENMTTTDKLPAIVWLKVTDYMHGWIQHDLGGSLKVRDQRVVCLLHLEGARDVMLMESQEDSVEMKPVGNAMSATLRNCIDAGLRLDPDWTRRAYGVDYEGLKLFMPIECPPNCITETGTLRPWSLDTSFGQRQATAMQRLLRQVFWEAVEDFDREYAALLEGRDYPAVDMIEAFCRESHTPELYIEPMRREWQRRRKRQNN